MGTGEKGFKTLELRLIGPTLVGCGFLCCLIRILLCVCPSRCFHRRKRKRCRHTQHNSSHHHPIATSDPATGATGPGDGGSIRRYRHPIDDFRIPDHTTSLLRKSNTTNGGNKKRVSIAGHPSRHAIPSTSSQSNNLASTSLLFHENEQQEQVPEKRIPTIQYSSELNKTIEELITTQSQQHQQQRAESIIELQNLEMYDDDVSSGNVSDDDSDDEGNPIEGNKKVCKVDVMNNSEGTKITRKREPLNSQTLMGLSSNGVTSGVMETSLCIPESNKHELNNSVHMDTLNSISGGLGNNTQLNEVKISSGEIVLSPSKLGQ